MKKSSFQGQGGDPNYFINLWLADNNKTIFVSKSHFEKHSDKIKTIEAQGDALQKVIFL